MTITICKTNHETERTKLGEIIAEIRMDKLLTQQDITARTGINQSRLANIEKGRVNFTIDTLLDIAEALEVSAGYILLKALWDGKAIKVEEETKEKIIRDIVTSIIKNLE